MIFAPKEYSATITLNEIPEVCLYPTISSTTEEISNAIEKVSNALKKINVTVKDAAGNFRSFGDVFREVYDNWDKCPEDVQDNIAEELLRPATFETTENPNEKWSFNFLEQNAYDHLEPIFYPNKTNMFLLDKD